MITQQSSLELCCAISSPERGILAFCPRDERSQASFDGSERMTDSERMPPASKFDTEVVENGIHLHSQQSGNKKTQHVVKDKLAYMCSVYLFQPPSPSATADEIRLPHKASPITAGQKVSRDAIIFRARRLSCLRFLNTTDPDSRTYISQ